MKPPSTPRPELSVVIPLFNEEENFEELFRRLVESLEPLRVTFEIVFVNDGSRDDTARLLDAAHCRDPRVTVIHLSRNFGQQAAYSAGMDHARGRAIVLMDGDLQDPPEVLGQFLDAWRNGAEVVYAVRTQRKEGLIKRACYAVFYRTFRMLSEMPVPLDSGDFCLMDRKVLRALRRLPERQRFHRGLRSFVGFRQVGIEYQRPGRNAGQTKFTLKALVRLGLDGLIGFSGWPLTLISLAGLGTLAAAALFTIGFLALGAVSGWTCTLAVVLWLSGVQLFSLGVLGEYVQRIFTETKRRPSYVIRTIHANRSHAGVRLKRA